MVRVVPFTSSSYILFMAVQFEPLIVRVVFHSLTSFPCSIMRSMFLKAANTYWVMFLKPV